MTLQPVTTAPLDPGGDSARLEYDFYSFSSGETTVIFHLAPSLDIQSGEGLRFALSVDDGPIEILRVGTWETHPDWQRAVGTGVREVTTTLSLERPGQHTLKIWAVTPAVVLQRIILDFGGVRSSYLGPPESPRF